MAKAQTDRMGLAALAVLKELDVPMSPRVAAHNFDVVSKPEAEELFCHLEMMGYVEPIDDDIYQLTDRGRS